MRRGLAYFVAILGAALIPGLIVLLSDLMRTGELTDVRHLFAYGLLFALLCLLPASFVLRRFGWFRRGTFLLVAFAAVVLYECVDVLPGGMIPLGQFVYATVLEGALGVASAQWFWLVVRNLPPAQSFDANTRWRTPVAILVGALAAAAMPAVILAVFVLAGTPDTFSLEFLLPIATIFVFGLAHALVLGLPIAWWLRRNGWLHVVPVAILGAIVGSVPYGLHAFNGMLLEILSTPDGWMAWLSETGLLAVLGMIGALTFLGVYRAITGEGGVQQREVLA
jgi:hypothetical protein